MSKKRLDREKKKRPKEINGLGRFLMKLPPWPILYPLYLANQLDLEEELYWSPRLPLEFDGLRIVFLSDIHYGPLYSEERVRDLAERVNALHADIVILGGDYGVNSFGALEFFALKPHFQANIAVLAVLGNHDRMVPEENKEKILAAMREDGSQRVLRNGRAVYRKLNSELRMLGFTGSKASYELRKICIDHIYQRFGAEMAVSISGDDIRMVTRYYADPSAVVQDSVRVSDLLAACE